MMKVFLCGPKGAGKTTAARYLEYRYGAKVYTLAAPLYQICRDLFGMKEKNRRLLQNVGDALRSVDPEVFLKNVIRRIEEEKPYFAVVEDVRLPNEVEYLIARGFYGIKLHTPDPIRAARLLARGGETIHDNHHTETLARKLRAHLVIDNSGGVEELEHALDKAVELLGSHSFASIISVIKQRRGEG